MSLASASIKNPVFAWMLMLFFIVFGLIGVQRLPQGQYPDIDFPIVTINCTLTGAAPEIMERDVADVIEDNVMACEGIVDIQSVSKQGQATITIEFALSRNVEQALQDVQARVAQAAKLLPKTMDPPIINKTNPEENPIMWVALSGTRSQSDISQYAKNSLRDKFLTVAGDGDIMMGGYLERNARIWVDAKKLEAYGLASEDVVNAFQNGHVEVPAGRVEGILREANVEVQGEAANVQQMGDILVARRNGSPIYLKDIALVEDGFEDRRRIARSNGLPAQGLGIIKQHGANTVEVANGVRKRVVELRKTLPKGMDLDIRVDNSIFIKEAVSEIEFTLTMSVLLTAVVCWLFLGSLSSTLNVLLAIPVSVFGTFAVMYFAGFSLNTFTLLALSLSIGIVVDDAVMVLENIYRHAEMGKDKVAAAREGTEQISFAALAATMAIIAIFLPVAFMTGIIGKFFFQFGVVLSVAVAISLLEAMTLAPARCSQFLSVGQRANVIERVAHSLFESLSGMYRGVLKALLGFRTDYTGKPIGLILTAASGFISFFLIKTGTANIVEWRNSNGERAFDVSAVLLVIVGLFGMYCAVGLLVMTFRRRNFPTGSALVLTLAVAFFAASLYFATILPKEMVPAQDQGYYMIRVFTPVGSTVDYTNRVMYNVEKLLEKHEEIEATLVIAGLPPDVNAGIAFITLKPQKDRTIKQQESMAMLRKELAENPSPGSRVILVDFSQTGFANAKRGAAAIEYSIRGPDWDQLGLLDETFMSEMKNSGVFQDIDTDYQRGMPELDVIPDREKCMANNVDVQALANTVSYMVGGQKIGTFKDNGKQYDVRVRLLQQDRSRREDVSDLYVRSKDGNLVRVSDVANISLRPSFQSISRQMRQRAVSLSANPAPGHAQAEAIDWIKKMAKERLPEGYNIYFSGNSKAFQESFDSLIFALVLGLVVAYMVLASQFNSFLHPVTVLMALPFSVSGALIALYCARFIDFHIGGAHIALGTQSLNVFSVIGLILLMGIVKKNSILLVDYTNQVREAGKPCDDALIEACPTRLRPILMTSVATIAGALPAALAIGPGGELMIPMSISVIGGLTVSTILTLVVVPCFYSIMDEMKESIAALFKSSEESPSIMPEPHAAGK
jgi:multidrug efflux pump subunit AcrB